MPREWLVRLDGGLLGVKAGWCLLTSSGEIPAFDPMAFITLFGGWATGTDLELRFGDFKDVTTQSG